MEEVDGRKGKIAEPDGESADVTDAISHKVRDHTGEIGG